MVTGSCYTQYHKNKRQTRYNVTQNNKSKALKSCT